MIKMLVGYDLSFTIIEVDKQGTFHYRLQHYVNKHRHAQLGTRTRDPSTPQSSRKLQEPDSETAKIVQNLILISHHWLTWKYCGSTNLSSRYHHARHNDSGTSRPVL
ncbi:hypothetical protein BO82DRAFT_95202 [Aspergillus uvarum CBS 121591]|uniref:Uncharacterized protein n=1 Tax=Aspergillus uvarum CBS 121591 TaxID=1448315 RepID=A0A319CQN9_9EURO|nr:hypothetical protein BO82DRAFT_95202 [Aspergillus uvarum CBS 121591]PYH81113.1 hypothetical protein BO82DRAFT_95202 [Aspergillus uvarum CBS 121591]